jgi:penicillin-binding protein 1A
VKKQWYNQQKKTSSADDRIIRNYELFGWNGTEVKKISRIDSLWYYYKMLNAAVLIINPKDGSVITWIGGNQFATLPFDMVLSHRQIASAFKPFLYATALEQGITPCDYFGNDVNKYPAYEDWEPQNYDRKSTPDSTVAFWYALANSMNLPTIDLYFKVGRENLINTCNRLHFPVITDDSPSIAIGTLDLSLYEIVSAYASFAQNGEMNDLVMINKITNAAGKAIYSRKSQVPQTVFSKETTATMTAVLQEAINHGTGTRIRNRYGIRSDVAGKTGTAQNYSDAWFIAYTPDLVLGTWIGARTRDIHFFSSNGSGSTLALPVIAKILQSIERDPMLRKTYLTPFDLPAETYSFLQCDPFRQTGVKGFFNRLFRGKAKKQNTNTEKWKKGKRK